jgi:hypothetical protein
VCQTVMFSVSGGRMISQTIGEKEKWYKLLLARGLHPQAFIEGLWSYRGYARAGPACARQLSSESEGGPGLVQQSHCGLAVGRACVQTESRG